jgi:3-hydroxyisobutyrate dehydrogenase-like beta-hydroxyacid dehydrogenase
MIKSVGYIGAGLMGAPMIKRLSGLGYRVRAYDVAPDRVNEARAAGAIIVGSPADAALGVDIVALNLPTPAAVVDAVFGRDGMSRTIKPPTSVVDFSTIPIEDAVSLADRLGLATGCRWIDAPVSGGPIASGEGTLTIMAGGDGEEIARLHQFFRDVSANFTHVGGTGKGLVAKMVSQHVVGCLHVVLGEAAMLAELCGIDSRIVPDCIKGGHADGELMRQLFPRMANRDFVPRAYSRQLAKDLHLLENLAERVGLEAPMLHQATKQYARLIDAGFSELDSAAIVKVYEPEGWEPASPGAPKEQGL